MAGTVNVGLIGHMFMGVTHSNAYLKVDKFFKLKKKPVMKVVCGLEPDVPAFAKKWGWESSEKDYMKVIKRPDIDLIDIATPNNTHKKIVLAALKAGKHVLCEKPLAMNAGEARQMADAAKKAGVKHMISFNYRRVPALSLAKRIIDEGRIGKIYHVRAVYLQDWIMDPNFPLVWRLKKEVAGSGAHGDLNAHMIDMARFLVGEFDSVCGMAETFIKMRPTGQMSGGLSAKGGKKKGKVTVDDAVLFLARFANGAIGTFEATRFAKGRRNGNGIEINGSKGSLAFNFERMNELKFFSDTDPDHIKGFKTILVTEPCHPYTGNWWPAGHIIGYEHTFINQLADLLNGLDGRKQLSPNFEDGLKCQLVLDGVLDSAKKRRWAKIPAR